ncbi:MAG TPA: FAD-binding oxidoreductase, partial [Luteolibacter sp.]
MASSPKEPAPPAPTMTDAPAPLSDVSRIAADLTARLGEGKVDVRDEAREANAGDKWYARRLPDVVVFAESTADVSAVMHYAYRNKIPVTTRGAGFGYVGGCVPVQGGIVLSTMRMNRILEIAPADGAAVVQPGVI